MAQVINTNIMSINAQRNLNRSQSMMATSLERLSSGLRVNRAADDAAGLALASSFQSQWREDTMKIRNAGDGISFVQTAEAALSEVQNMLQRMIELNEQKSGGLVGSEEINLELTELSNEIASQLGQSFNDTSINGATVVVADVTLGGTAVSDTIAASTSGADLKTALGNVTTLRATYGAQQNRLEARVRFLEANVESFKAAESRIMDADFAVETANLTRTQILQQAGTAMLAQANAMPQNALALLR